MARTGCNRTVEVVLLQEEQEAVGEAPWFTRCWDELTAADVDMTTHFQFIKLFS